MLNSSLKLAALVLIVVVTGWAGTEMIKNIVMLKMAGMAMAQTIEGVN